MIDRSWYGGNDSILGFLVNALLEMSLLCKWAVAIYPVLKIDKEIRQDYVFTLSGYFFLGRQPCHHSHSLS